MWTVHIGWAAFLLEVISGSRSLPSCFAILWDTVTIHMIEAELPLCRVQLVWKGKRVWRSEVPDLEVTSITSSCYWEFSHVVIARQAWKCSPVGKLGVWLPFYYCGRRRELSCSFYHSLPLQPSNCLLASFFPHIKCTHSLPKENNSDTHSLVQEFLLDVQFSPLGPGLTPHTQPPNH